MILALRSLGLGDLLTAVPALRALRRHRPAEELVLAAPAALAPLVRRISAVDRLHAVPSAVAAAPRSLSWPDRPPELAVNLHGKGPQSTALLRRTSPRALWSFDTSAGPRWSGREHDVTRWCRLLVAHGCPADPQDLYLVPERLSPETIGDRPVLVHPGATAPQRRWPASRYAAVARHLAGWANVYVTAGPGERGRAGHVARLAGLPPAAIVSNLDLADLADLVHESALVVSADTGVAHLATACRTPSVVLFGPQSPGRWGPPVDGRHQVLWRPAPGDARVPRRRVHPALLRVSVPDVLEAVARIYPEVDAPGLAD